MDQKIFNGELCELSEFHLMFASAFNYFDFIVC